MQILMNFLETKPAEAGEPVWAALDLATRSEIVGMLARLIAKAVAPTELGADQEVRDE